MFHGLNSIFHPLLSDTHYYLPSHPGTNFQLCLANPRALDSLARIYVGIYLLCPCHVLLHMATHPAVKVLDTYLMNKQYGLCVLYPEYFSSLYSKESKIYLYHGIMYCSMMSDPSTNIRKNYASYCQLMRMTLCLNAFSVDVQANLQSQVVSLIKEHHGHHPHLWRKGNEVGSC